MASFRSFIAKVLWPRLELPVVEIILHFIVTVLSILTIAGIELVLYVVGLDGRQIPLVKITLGELMFVLEVVAAGAIIFVGITKAVLALVRS